MHKHTVTTRTTLFFLCLLLLLWGCGGETEAPQQPKVVTKKITVKKGPEAKPVVTAQADEKEPVPKKPEPEPSVTDVVTTLADDAKNKKPTAPITAGEPPVTASPAQVAIYSLEGKVDPFEPLFKAVPAATKTVEKREAKIRTPLTPLEKIDLSQLKLAGIILADSGNKALVEEASGKGYVIEEGTYMGTRAGRVDKILPHAVIVDEPLLPVEEVNKDSIYDVDGKNFSIYYSEGKRFINIDGKKFEAKISQVDGKSYFVDPKELTLPKPPGEE
ncbi:MAG: pilus assembly protein PilP [Pseudomonadota bacterium]